MAYPSEGRAPYLHVEVEDTLPNRLQATALLMIVQEEVERFVQDRFPGVKIVTSKVRNAARPSKPAKQRVMPKGRADS